jgi:hypothetical protein
MEFTYGGLSIFCHAGCSIAILHMHVDVVCSYHMHNYLAILHGL